MIPAEWHDLTDDGKLRAIYNLLGDLMAREQELETIVGNQTVAIDALRTEVVELRIAGDGAIGRLRDTVAAQTTAIAALTEEVALVREGAVSAEKAAELQAASDAAVANAASSKADADAAEAAWDAIGQPPA